MEGSRIYGSGDGKISKNGFTGIFESLLDKEPLFVNKDALRHSYKPAELPHRDSEVEQLASILVESLKGSVPSNILIYGKSGTGKTIVTKFVCNLLFDTSKNREHLYPVSIGYVNCKLVDTQYRILADLTKQFCDEIRIPFTGWPGDKVYKTFKKGIDSKKQCVVIILDEIDKLVKKQGDDILYNITRINDDLKNAKVSIIGISNDLKFVDYLDARVQSSLGSEEIVFTPYDARQLEDILNHRAAVAFEAGVVDDYVVPLCSALAAREHGDARKALDLLRTSGEVAERERTDRITETHVRQANEKIEKDTVVEAVKTLPIQSKLLLYSIIILEEEHGNKTLNTGEVYDKYRKLCIIISLDSLTQRRVSDLISELDVLGILDSRVVSRGRYGRTKEIKLDMSPVGLKAILEETKRIGKLAPRP
ncbi:ORC1-type DNA replication protein [Candidatus Pacearchaeota archaeon]|nr:ORC1-type DNA replication protein [Candidatus Pacearchaeota archaeon]